MLLPLGRGGPARAPRGIFDRSLTRICRPVRSSAGRAPCERCGAPHSWGFSFERWCRGSCDRGAADRRLLILACSARKARLQTPAPAWHVYDGGLFRICKALVARGGWPGDVGVRILSAEHGLIRPDTAILPYDRRMTPERARQLRGWANQIALAVFEEEAGEAYLAMGASYMPAVDGLFPAHVTVTNGAGQVGEMQSRLKDWLGDRPIPLPDLFSPVARMQNTQERCSSLTAPSVP